MNGTAHNGVLIYSNNLTKLAAFYQELFEMQLLKQTDDFISLAKDSLNLIVHTTPVELPDVHVSPLKLFLTVTDMTSARTKAIELGGDAFDGEWANPLFKVSNIADSDGNHVQLREFFNRG